MVTSPSPVAFPSRGPSVVPRSQSRLRYVGSISEPPDMRREYRECATNGTTRVGLSRPCGTPARHLILGAGYTTKRAGSEMAGRERDEQGIEAR